MKKSFQIIADSYEINGPEMLIKGINKIINLSDHYFIQEIKFDVVGFTIYAIIEIEDPDHTYFFNNFDKLKEHYFEVGDLIHKEVDRFNELAEIFKC